MGSMGILSVMSEDAGLCLVLGFKVSAGFRVQVSMFSGLRLRVMNL